MQNSKNPIVSWIFGGVGIALLVINAALTFQFGSKYFAASFSSGLAGSILAGVYALLIMDIAYVAWFAVYLRGSSGTKQRALSVVMAGLSLAGSIMATVYQLISNSNGLGDFSVFNQQMGAVSLVGMVILTAGHIASGAFFILFDPNEQIKTKGAETLSNVIDAALLEVGTRLNQDKATLVDHISAGYRVEMLHALGFTAELQKVGESTPLLAPVAEHATPAATIAEVAEEAIPDQQMIVEHPYTLPNKQGRPNVADVTTATEQAQMNASGDDGKPSIQGGHYPNVQRPFLKVD